MNDDLHNHPAVQAWLKLDSCNKIPHAISPLYAKNRKRKKTKSAVFKLEGNFTEETVVVAKQCSSETARIERIVYEKILPKLPIVTLNFFGYVESQGQHWLFIEYAGGATWSPKNPVHVDLAANWLANLHCGSSHIKELSLLPEKKLQHYLAQLNQTLLRAKEAASGASLNHEELSVIEEIYRCSDVLESKWSEVNSFCDSIPTCLGHNDFVDKNIQVDEVGASINLYPFDWEMAAKSVPAVDLYWMPVKAGPDQGPKAMGLYLKYRNQFGENLALADIEHLARLGVIFRYLDALEWASQSFGYETAEERGRNLMNARLYVEKMNNILGVLGWL